MTLRYVPYPELERLRGLDVDPVARAAAFADACRLNALYEVLRAHRLHAASIADRARAALPARI